MKEAVEYLKLTPEACTGSALDFVAVHEQQLVSLDKTLHVSTILLLAAALP